MAPAVARNCVFCSGSSLKRDRTAFPLLITDHRFALNLLSLYRVDEADDVIAGTKKIARVIVKNARGHAYHEIGEPTLDAPDLVSFAPLEQLSPEQCDAFEAFDKMGELSVWPEVGSRMTVQLVEGEAMIGGWITVEPSRYRYCIDGQNYSEDCNMGVSSHPDKLVSI